VLLKGDTVTKLVQKGVLVYNSDGRIGICAEDTAADLRDWIVWVPVIVGGKIETWDYRAIIRY